MTRDYKIRILHKKIRQTTKIQPISFLPGGESHPRRRNSLVIAYNAIIMGPRAKSGLGLPFRDSR